MYHNYIFEIWPRYLKYQSEAEISANIACLVALKINISIKNVNALNVFIVENGLTSKTQLQTIDVLCHLEAKIYSNIGYWAAILQNQDDCCDR